MEPMDARYPSLKGRHVVITGGASGIGESIVEHFAAEEAEVSFLDIQREAGQALADRIAAAGAPRPDFLACDLTDLDALRAAIGAAMARHGAPAALVNNAANDDRHRIEAVTAEYWQNRMDTNLRHQFFAAQAVRPAMRDAGGGSIICFGSISWMAGEAGYIAYVTAKAAIGGLTKGLARELGPERIRVNCVVPGWVMTKRQVALWLDEAGERQIAERQCLPDKLMPADLARMVLWLAAADSRMCTAQNFIVDAGWV
ncbi:MAG TPA: SDR family oxidoreductase [Acetobacteraceae bacterium]|nr:SDR family oxidoreductase [Acetobacteraceae bacterium]